jgi:hypothetical protein
VREVKIEKHFTGSQAKGKGLARQGTEAPLSRSPVGRCAHGGHECWNAFAKTGESGEGND